MSLSRRLPGIRPIGGFAESLQFACPWLNGCASPDAGRSLTRADWLYAVGISTQFPIRGGRYALVGVGAVLLIISFV